jgi:predicted nuclease of predicted toxin-antitoxin system
VHFVADENLDWPIIDQLRKDGHTVVAVVELAPGVSDPDVLGIANRQNAVLITADKDFGELVYRQQQLSTGVILVRLVGVAPQKKAQLVANAIAQLSSSLVGAFTVVTPTSVRHRPRRGV